MRRRTFLLALVLAVGAINGAAQQVPSYRTLKYPQLGQVKIPEPVEVTLSNGMRLLKLINDLLDLVRLESGRLEVKHESLNVVDFVKGLARYNGSIGRRWYSDRVLERLRTKWRKI